MTAAVLNFAHDFARLPSQDEVALQARYPVAGYNRALVQVTFGRGPVWVEAKPMVTSHARGTFLAARCGPWAIAACIWNRRDFAAFKIWLCGTRRGRARAWSAEFIV